jgi:hypothetical protein
MGSSLTLVVVAWSWCSFAWTTPVRLFGLLVALGMTLGFTGDLILADILPFPSPVLGGIGAFGLGHIAYCAALLHFARRSRIGAPAQRWAAWLCWLILAAIAWAIIGFPSAQPAALRWAALPYTLLLASTAGLATGLALQVRPFIPLAVGSALFLFSDLILAGQLFEAFHFPLLNAAVWLTYGPGQMLIVYSVNGAIQAEKESRQ